MHARADAPPEPATSTAPSISWPAEIFSILQHFDVRQVPYVPDAGHSELIQLVLGSSSMRGVALTTEEERVSVARLQLAQLLDQLEVFQKHIPLFDTQIKTVFADHPNADLFRDLPGAGPQLAPRLCVAFGTIASLYPKPSSLQKYAGIAPVREKSGNQVWTHGRWQAPAFLRQTFVEWAGQTVRYSAWARAYYGRMLKKGKKHAVIIRALAFKWIRILWKCWQDQTPYQEARYLKQLVHRKSPNAVSP